MCVGRANQFNGDDEESLQLCLEGHDKIVQIELTTHPLTCKHSSRKVAPTSVSSAATTEDAMNAMSSGLSLEWRCELTFDDLVCSERRLREEEVEEELL